MNNIHQKLTIATTSALVILGSLSPAQAYQFFDNADAWEATVAGATQTLYFGPTYRQFSQNTVFPNGVSVSPMTFGAAGIGFAWGTSVGAIRPAPGELLRARVTITLPNGVNALAFNPFVGTSSPFRASLSANFISETGLLSQPGTLGSGAFAGVITEPGDPLISGLSISNGSGVQSFSANNIRFSIVPIPESSSTLGLLATFGIFAYKIFLYSQRHNTKVTKM